ncbi:Fe-S cluster assembly protein SufD [Maritalea porphyrae]|uniref:Fe-S cluster assembly protein SufD n=1 Tax=Maritalea porphyrae TaxID=880732 RepID=UPI0022B00B12|nr:Fe-S cluster assembly protein SufD [Maritalea porphyrae]MCZ4272982.1 Fe-S cluster assembly protein SufD [Maritalea porphyrae]
MNKDIKLSGAEEQLQALLLSHGNKEAAAQFAANGLPTRRIEAYHYTDLKSLLREVPSALAVANDGASAKRSNFDGVARIEIVNGQLAGDFDVEGVSVATSGNTGTGDDSVVLLSEALVGDVVEIKISGELDQVLHIDRIIDGDAAINADKVSVTLEDGAKATLVETYNGSDAAHLRLATTEVVLGEGAEFSHFQLDGNSSATRHFANNRYELNADAQLSTFVQQSEPQVSRTTVSASFVGGGAHADFAGLNMLSGTQHGDITVHLRHLVADTTSTEVFKNIVNGRGKAVFQGKIDVAQPAQKTDAQMMCQGLILSERGEVLVKPELEIFADDVLCAHGATCGELDENSMFYLMSRGIPRTEAKAMLIRAFLAEVFEPVDVEAVVHVLEARVDSWLQEQEEA